MKKLMAPIPQVLINPAVSKCAARSQPAEPVTTECISLSAGEEPLCLPRGKDLAFGGTTQEWARNDLSPLRSPAGGLPKLRS